MPTQFFYGVYPTREGGGVFMEWSMAKTCLDTVRNGRVKKFAYQADACYFAEHGHGPFVPLGLRVQPGSIVVYTDGSAFQQKGTGDMVAGYGVWFNDRHPLNEGRPLEMPPMTNNRAELRAIQRAIEIIASEEGQTHLPTFFECPFITILTDSTYARDALGKWRKGWERNNFRDNTILNRDIIEAVWNHLDHFRRGTITIAWLKGHCGLHGNEQADALAKQGAMACGES